MTSNSSTFRSERIQFELRRGGDTFTAEPTETTQCALMRNGEAAGWIQGAVHFHSIDDSQADVTIPMTLSFTAIGEPDLGVEHSLNIAVTYDFTSPQ